MSQQWFYIGTNMFTFVIFAGKISLVLLYLRIWYGRDAFRTTCCMTLLFLVSALVAFQVLAIVQCLPISSQWKQYVSTSAAPKCINRQMWVWGLTGADLGINVLVMVVPIPKLMKINVPSSRKLG